MTLFFYVADGSDLGAQAVRLGSGFSFTEAADSGMYAMSQVQIDDPSGSRSITGHWKFRAIETACTSDSLYRGYFADRGAVRADSMLTGAARRYDGTVYDLNGALQFEVIQSGGKRPAETDTARLAWLLGSGYIGPVDTHDDHVFGAGVSLDKADYTGQTMADVLSDCAQTSGCNYFAAWDDTRSAPMLHYYLPTSTHNTCTLSISNVRSDVDGSTVYAPSKDAKLSRDPSRVYTGVRYGYGDRQSAVYRTSATILASIGHKRETQFTDPSVRTAAKAQAKADKWLSEGESEVDTISVTLHKVPPSKVNLVRAGQRISVRFTHLPGYETASYIRVTRRTVAQDGDDALHYRIDLELSTPKQGGTRVRHAPRPVAPEPADGSALTVARWMETSQSGEIDQAARAPSFSFAGPDGVTPTYVTEGVNYYTTYIYAGCPMGENGWSGVQHQEQWFVFGPGDMDTAGIIGVRLDYTVGTIEGIAGSQEFAIGVSQTIPPTDMEQFTEIARAPVASGSVFVPRSQLTSSVDNAIVIAPGWHCARGIQVCGGQLTNTPNAGPTRGGGEFESGRVTMTGWTITPVMQDGMSGLIPWQTPIGTIDGSNRTYTLPSWNGLGTPSVRIGAVTLSAGSDYTWDGTAGTITLRMPPWAGADLQARWLA